MERRLHERWPADIEVQVTKIRDRDHFGTGHVCDISKSGVAITAPLQFAPGDLVQLEMAHSVLFGHVAHCNPEGALFRTGIEIVQVLLGGTELSRILQTTLQEVMPGTPGLEPSKLHLV